MTTLEKGIEIALDLRALISEKNSHRYMWALEAGVYKGDTLTTLAKAFKPAVNGITVAGFDSFEGLPEDWSKTVCKKGHFSTDGEVPQAPIEEGAFIFPGWFEDTLPGWVKENNFQNWPIALLHLDCDLYSSTKTVLSILNHLIVHGTVIVCDEWIYNQDPNCNDHEQKAFLEWLEAHDRRVIRIYHEDPDPCGPERALFLVTK
jgi:hypothetical protein